MSKTIEPKISIVISCHKPIDYPHSDVYLPVHVGASKAPRTLDGMQPDNEGDNISNRNFTFCELTAQYWAWKNLDSDYIGQCHYRRFFCFDGKKYKANDHAQIEEPVLSQFSIDKYQLDNSELIQSCIKGADLIRAPYWNVLGSVTLDGTKKTIRDHMVGYGLLLNSDLDRLIEIVDRLKPEYSKELRDYLNGSKYLGYNCFVMKRELFEQLCEFEFPVLLEFDRSFNYENMTTTRKRICGYLGEVLYSVFVNKVAQEKRYNIKEFPLVFFEDTPAPYSVSSHIINENDLSIVWRYEDSSAARLSVSVISLINNLSPNKKYHVTIIHSQYFKMEELKRFLPDIPSNLILEDATYPLIECAIDDERLTERELYLLLPLLIAARSKELTNKPILWIDGCCLFESDPISIFDQKNVDIVATSGIELEKTLNMPFNHSILSRYLELESSRAMFDSSLLAFPNETNNETVNIGSIIKLYRSISTAYGFDIDFSLKQAEKQFNKDKHMQGNARNQFVAPLDCKVLMSALLARLNSTAYNYSEVLPVLSNGDTLIWANEDDAKAWASTGSAKIYLYRPESGPFIDNANQFCLKYWRIARRSDAYEVLLRILTEYRPIPVKDRVLPPFSRRRRLLGRIKGVVRHLIRK